jgi:hypothetical protein
VADKTIHATMIKDELRKVISITNPIPMQWTFWQKVMIIPFFASQLHGYCELNPVELAWAQVKGYPARHNTGLSGLLHNQETMP